MEAGPPELCGGWFTGCRCHGSSPVFWVSGKQAGYDGALFLIPGCSSGCLFPSFFCRWGCPGRLGYPLSRRSVQVLCGSGNHSRGLDIEAICPVSSLQLPFSCSYPNHPLFSTGLNPSSCFLLRMIGDTSIPLFATDKDISYKI